MKKVIFAIGVLVALSSCGTSSTEATTTVDSTKVVVDTTKKVVTIDSAKVDTTKAVK